MQKVEEHTILEVGRYYMVPCARVVEKATDKFLAYVPVIGKPHRDPQFGVAQEHYHIDGRFIHLGNRFMLDDYGRTNKIISTQDESFEFAEQIVYMKKRCIRLTTGINPPPGAKSYYEWYDTMVGKSCKGKRCPHLGTLMHERNGELVCPLHNLRGCINTETIKPENEYYDAATKTLRRSKKET